MRLWNSIQIIQHRIPSLSVKCSFKLEQDCHFEFEDDHYLQLLFIISFMAKYNWFLIPMNLRKVLPTDQVLCVPLSSNNVDDDENGWQSRRSSSCSCVRLMDVIIIMPQSNLSKTNIRKTLIRYADYICIKDQLKWWQLADKASWKLAMGCIITRLDQKLFI